MASMGFCQQSFLTNALIPSFKPNCINSLIPSNIVSISCGFQSDEPKDSSRKKTSRLAELAIVTLAAGVLALSPVDPALAGTGGRVGGKAFRPSTPRPSRPSGPRINNSRTNIYVNPPIAPPLVGGYGYGYGYGVPFYGGWGPSVVVGGGFDTLVLFMFLGAAAAVVRKFFNNPRNEDDDDY